MMLLYTVLQTDTLNDVKKKKHDEIFQFQKTSIIHLLFMLSVERLAHRMQHLPN